MSEDEPGGITKDAAQALAHNADFYLLLIAVPMNLGALVAMGNLPFAGYVYAASFLPLTFGGILLNARIRRWRKSLFPRRDK